MLKRGFKSQCERRSIEIRRKFGLEETSPLSAFDLAEAWGVTVWGTHEVERLEAHDLRQLTVVDGDSWSALTLRIGTRHLAIYNHCQSGPRINSVLMHELSHIILGHELSGASLSDDGHLIVGNYDQDQEDEADWLGGTLLLPRPALLFIRRSGFSDEQAREKYQVSSDMLRWRVRMTGVDYQMQNSRRRQISRA